MNIKQKKQETSTRNNDNETRSFAKGYAYRRHAEVRGSKLREHLQQSLGAPVEAGAQTKRNNDNTNIDNSNSNNNSNNINVNKSNKNMKDNLNNRRQTHNNKT